MLLLNSSVKHLVSEGQAYHMKRIGRFSLFILYFLLLLLICTGCEESTTSNPTSIIESGGSAEEIKPANFIQFLDQCTVAAKVRIIESNPFSTDGKVYQFKCEVLEDYFGNIDYDGVEPGFIYVYDQTTMEPEEIRYMFLDARELLFYPHLPYAQIGSDFRVRIEDNRLVFTFPTCTYGLSESDDLDAIIRNYAENTDLTEKLITYFPQIGSYEDMASIATDVWLIEVKQYSPHEVNLYCGTINFEIIEVLRGEYDLTEEGSQFYKSIISSELSFEPGERYILMLGKYPYYEQTTTIISEHYAFLYEHEPMFDVFMAQFK